MPPSQEQPDLRQALLGSSLGAPVFAAGLAQQDTEDTSKAATAKGVLDRLGRSSASAHAEATEFPDTYDELDELDELEELPAGGLTLLPTAEFSDTDDYDGEEEEEEEEEGGRGSQFAQFADARVVSDIHTGQVVLQRREEGEGEARLSESDRRDAERQGVEVAGILGGMTIRKEMEENARLAAQSIAVFSPAERYAAYRTAMERKKEQQARGEDEIAEEEEIRKRQRIADGTTLPGAGSGNVKSKDTPTAAPLLVDILSAKYALPPETGDFVTARTARGRSLYFAVRSDIDAAKRMDRMAAAAAEGSEAGRMGAAQTNRVVGGIEAELGTAAAGAGSETTGPPAQHGTLPQSSSSSSMLWVDKYRARTFVDLVSDERTNRAVMQWLKEWDYCVFGRASSSGGADGNTDRWRRPLRRILLLSGPPGLGKTTLAHVAAAQAGYAVVEINASDDRTAARIRDRVVGATQTHAMRAAARPQLLVIDEIDGVSGAQATQGGDLATMLVRLASSGSGDRRQRKGDPGALLRPIICICNNAYAPALRALRQAAVCYHVHPPTAARLARRLEEVCAAEGVAADTWGLVEVAKQHGGDMRACLNALQLACASGRRESGTLEERMRRAGGGGGGGTKDVQRSLFGVWALVFTRPDAAATAAPAFGVPRRAGDASHARMLVEAVATSGELERVMQGCFENYLRMDFRDLTHTRVAELSGGWLSFHDSVDHACRRSPLTAAALHPYLAYAALAVHRTCSSAVGLARGDFEYPHSEYDAFQRRQATHAVAQSLVAAGRLRASVDSTVAVVGFADYLLHILSPPQLVSSNKHLLKPPEQAALDRLVQVMAAWRLSFVQTRDVGSGSTDQLVYRLDPPIDRLVAYAGRRPALPVLPMRYPVRQLVAREMELAVRARAARDAGGSAREGDAAKRDYLAKLFADPLAAASGAGSKAEPAVARDFFGRIVVPPAAAAHKDGDSMRTGNPDSDSGAAACVPAAPRTWFRFFEGFSNAVRKPTQMRELF
ncbi:Chromosome transmission fidelity protein 18 [Coemansia sp. RSA 1939]|nr:Chromosome transmission fidelity protein 18 [Coemansia sp. RSA 1939]